MNRRSFFGVMAAAPVALAAMPAQSLASGGMVHGYAGVMIGESGPETIMPLRRMETMTMRFDEGALARMQHDIDARIAGIRSLIEPDRDHLFSDGDGI
jgi:hypothetical protein